MSKKDTTESEKSDKSDKSDKSKKASLIQRIVAYMIDMFVVVMITSLVVSPFVDTDTINKLQDSYEEVCEKYVSGEIDSHTYFVESMPLVYQMAREDGILSFVMIFLGIMYFIVFQFYNKGKTVGKNFMKIKVVSNDGDLTMNQLLIRSLIINFILVDLIVFGLVVFAPMDVYFYATLVFELIQYFVVFISIIMIILSKSKRGIHDFVSHCEVIREN